MAGVGSLGRGQAQLAIQPVEYGVVMRGEVLHIWSYQQKIPRDGYALEKLRANDPGWAQQWM